MMQVKMKRFFRVALAGMGIQAFCLAAGLTAASQLLAQAPAQNGRTAGQHKPADAAQPAVPPPANANPFPGDTTNVPVLPSAKTTVLPQQTFDGSEGGGIPLPGDDLDPVRSPDDIAPPADSATPAQWSSSLTGLDKVLPRPGDDQSEKKKKHFGREAAPPAPIHEEDAPEDLRVGGYYLQTHNWRGALSRFESALVLAPENPEVYWGLAECDRHLGNFADARANYQKVVEYDPGSRHGKDARKALEDPEIANGKNAAPSPAAAAETPR